MNPAILFRAEPKLLDAIDKARGETGRGRFVGDTMRRMLLGDTVARELRTPMANGADGGDLVDGSYLRVGAVVGSTEETSQDVGSVPAVDCGASSGLGGGEKDGVGVWVETREGAGTALSEVTHPCAK